MGPVGYRVYIYVDIIVCLALLLAEHRLVFLTTTEPNVVLGP